MVQYHLLVLFTCIGLALSQEAIASSPPRMKHVRAFTNGTGMGELPYERGGGDGGGGGGHAGDSSTSPKAGGVAGHSGVGNLLAPSWLVSAGLVVALHDFVPLPILLPFAASFSVAEFIDPQANTHAPAEVAPPIPMNSNKTYSIPPTNEKGGKLGKGKSGGGGGSSGVAKLSAPRWLVQASLIVAVSQYIALPMLISFLVDYANAESVKTGDAAPHRQSWLKGTSRPFQETIAWSNLSAVPITVDDGSVTIISVPPTTGMATAVTVNEAAATAITALLAAQNDTNKLVYVLFGGAASLNLSWTLLGLPLAMISLMCSSWAL